MTSSGFCHEPERDKFYLSARSSIKVVYLLDLPSGIEMSVIPQSPTNAQTAQSPARSDSRHFLLNYQEGRIRFWETAQMEAEDKPERVSQSTAAVLRRLQHPSLADANAETYAKVANRIRSCEAERYQPNLTFYHRSSRLPQLPLCRSL